ncbi:MAG TPA: cysteine--tRNA ligase [Verrucomicrobiae bacterium]|nr:cysteine--tRNA ligase [Verrucomicrobiae bacterium]
MALKLFNTLTRSVQEFEPRDPAGKKVGMYCCGPTVHDFAHIGNFRTFVFADLARRHLEFNGYEVEHVMNITDVEDKIIKRVRESNTSLREYTLRYEAAFFEDLERLGCLRPHQIPRATENIGEIISLIERLLGRGLAYRAADGSVYFSIEKYRGCGCQYGQLVKLNFDEMRAGERVSSDEYAKESFADFALWKARTPEDGGVFWPSPWGEGRPGWHIECSAMSMKILGPSFDLHLGGEDLIFPHHEDEIAQSEGAGLQPDGERFVKYWLHGAHLLVEGRKMSKSLGNYFTLRDLLSKGYSGREIRRLLLSAHYRESFNFTLEGLDAARRTLGRIDDSILRSKEHLSAGPQSQEANGVAEKELSRFAASLDSDLNVSAAWASVFEVVSELNALTRSDSVAIGDSDRLRLAGLLSTLKAMLSVFGIDERAQAEAPPEIIALLEQRQASRKARDFKRSDTIRDELKARGWIIEDTPKGPRLKESPAA